MFFTRLKRRVLAHYRFVRFAMAVATGCAVLFLLTQFLVPLSNLGRKVLPLIVAGDASLSQTAGRTNILLLGIGGRNHDGPNLTDSITLISIQTEFEGNQIPPPVAVSIPRDIYIEELSDKINSAYHQGEERRPGAGILMGKAVVSQITGVPIHYVVVVDFSGFIQAIDLLGGIDVTVEQEFDDYRYPLPLSQATGCVGDENAPCWYEHIRFSAGPTHMDGATALKFARSRHAQGDEGTDFARSRRQQLVLQAVRNKIISADTLLRPQKIEDLNKTLGSHITTDIKDQELKAFLNLALKYKNSSVKFVLLGEELFDNPPIDARGWILLPKGGNFSLIHQFITEQIGQLSLGEAL